MRIGEWMHVRGTVRPGAVPNHVVDDDSVFRPGEVRVSPAPGAEPHTNVEAESKVDRATDEESGTRAYEYNGRIVYRHINPCWINRDDLNVRRAAYNDLSVGSQIAIVIGQVAFTLHGIHHVIGLRQEGAA